jgi:anti-sigma factor RsiW
MLFSGNCNWVQSRLHAYADGELPPGPRAECERHLAGCNVCSKELSEIIDLQRFLAAHAVQVTVAESLAPRVLTRLDAAGRGSWRWWSVPLAASVALAVFLGFTAGQRLSTQALAAQARRAAEAQWQVDLFPSDLAMLGISQSGEAHDR